MPGKTPKCTYANLHTPCVWMHQHRRMTLEIDTGLTQRRLRMARTAASLGRRRILLAGRRSHHGNASQHTVALMNACGVCPSTRARVRACTRLHTSYLVKLGMRSQWMAWPWQACVQRMHSSCCGAIRKLFRLFAH